MLKLTSPSCFPHRCQHNTPAHAGLNPVCSPESVKAPFRKPRKYPSETAYSSSAPAAGTLAAQIKRPLELPRPSRTVLPPMISVGPPPGTPPKLAGSPVTLWPASLRLALDRYSKADGPNAREITTQLIWEASRPARSALCSRSSARTADM